MHIWVRDDKRGRAGVRSLKMRSELMIIIWGMVLRFLGDIGRIS